MMEFFSLNNNEVKTGHKNVPLILEIRVVTSSSPPNYINDPMFKAIFFPGPSVKQISTRG